jgi:hypothetical protein
MIVYHYCCEIIHFIILNNRETIMHAFRIIENHREREPLFSLLLTKQTKKKCHTTFHYTIVSIIKIEKEGNKDTQISLSLSSQSLLFLNKQEDQAFTTLLLLIGDSLLLVI